MAVPPIQRSPNAAAAGPTAGAKFPWLLDLVLGLLIVAALPLAIIAIPNTVSVVADLLPAEIDRVGLMRAHGLALPAMMLTVPLAAVVLRRLRVTYVLVAGLALLAVADAAGGYAGTTFMVGALRVLHGVGAGVLLPATLVAAWGRPPVIRAVWAGMLAVSLLAAQALALWPLHQVDRWQVTLQPYPLLTGIALALAAAYLLVWLLQGESASPTPRARERSRLLLAAVPAAGIAVLAISTASQDWKAGLVVLVAVLSIAALLALATIGTSESRTLAYTFVAIGVVLLPTVAQVTYVEMGGLGGPGLKGLWLPFVVAAVLTVVAGAAVALFGGSAVRWLAPAGLLLVVLGLAAVRLMVPAADGTVLVVPFTFMAVGAAVALTAALRQTSVGVALFGLALCFPGVLSGYLLGTGVQVMMLRGQRSAQGIVDAFVEALHTWALIGGFLTVAVIVLGALLARRSGGAVEEGDGASAGGAVPDGPEASGEVSKVEVRSDVRAFVVAGADAAEAGPEETGAERGEADAAGAEPGDEGAAEEERGDSGGVGDAPADVVEALEDEGVLDEGDRPTGEIPRVVLPTPVNGDSPETADPARVAGEHDGPSPAVPPPAQSPEDNERP
ncbi:hypothetical protein [Nonomuraea endophytica]|uniref:MFS transporter n=1 Tax=Nonomuraea endophytica TaxID=714136 RepID=A0A7W8AEJ8_9ACTN|nr:hypothetical protein [Nonomuraea endophytica]MBB5083735.1 hypothetical protein [Nonomuraea endophytica]